MGRNENEEFDLKLKYEKFAGELNLEIKEIKRFISFLLVDERDAKIFKEALLILSDKNKQIKNCTSLKEANEHVKLRKLEEKYGTEDVYGRS